MKTSKKLLTSEGLLMEGWPCVPTTKTRLRTAFPSAGRIGYSRIERGIEYTGVRGDLVVLMGGQIVVPNLGREVRRRFTDIWKPQNGRWLLTARQATIIGISDL